MKKVQYVASVMRAEDFAALFADKTVMPGQQAQKYNRLMIEGLAINDVSVHVISGVPITTRNFHSTIYWGKRVTEARQCYDYLLTVNFPVLKNLIQLSGAFFKVLLGRAVDAVICDVLNASIAFGASIAAKLRRRPFVGIVTDLPQMMVTGTGTKYSRMVERVIRNCTHYVFLTEQMNKAINIDQKPHIIVEGICNQKLQTVCKESRIEKRCMYAGLLDVRYGVKTMVEAFIMANVEGAELHIYGNGPYTKELQCIEHQHANIIYHGNVLNEEVIVAELESSLLINPRPSSEEFTMYSFPSKNIEYMASGTAVLTTNLPGMPCEYQPYVYLFDEETVEGMARKIREILSLSKKDLFEKGYRAQQFVLDKKNNAVQARKVIDMIKQN